MIVTLARIMFVAFTLYLLVASVGVVWNHLTIDPNKGMTILFTTGAAVGVIASWRKLRRRKPRKTNDYLPIGDLGVGAWRINGENKI